MSKSKANELLQKLCYGLTANWKGQRTDVKASEDAYRLCEEIVKEAREEEK